MDRTYVVTGAASGIGAATARYLRERGGRVIACDLHDADVIGDLATIEGRAELVDGVTRLSGGKIDAIVANAGGGPIETMLSLNFFGAVATLEGLRPLLTQQSGASCGDGVLGGLRRAVRSRTPRSLFEHGRTCGNRRVEGRNRGGKGAFGSVRQRQACVEPLVPKSRGQTGMGRRRNPAERGRTRFYRHACRLVHPVGSRQESGGRADGADARCVSRSS